MWPPHHTHYRMQFLFLDFIKNMEKIKTFVNGGDANDTEADDWMAGRPDDGTLDQAGDDDRTVSLIHKQESFDIKVCHVNMHF